MANNNRAKAADLTEEFKTISKDLKDSVNGVLAHELSVGDAAFIKIENKIVLPFNPHTQYEYTLMAGAKIDDARLLVIARLGLLAYWGMHLTGVDIDEQVPSAIIGTNFVGADANNNRTYTLQNAQDNYGIIAPAVVPVAEADQDFSDVKALGIHPGSGVAYTMIFLHMKDIGMLVAANLVRTGHHYQRNTNGMFRALERKRFTKEVFSEEVRGILYHESMHCFLQTCKLAIYNTYLAKLEAGNLDEPYTLLDTVVVKRVPVVPAGAAWLSAGITIMNEVLSIPKIADNVPDEYKTLVEEASVALKAVVKAGKLGASNLARFEGMAAFAHGILAELAPTHSAVNAPSLLKLADQHIGAKAAGTTLGRKVLRSD